MKFIFIGAGYCSEFIIPRLPDDSQIIGIHQKKPFTTRYKFYEHVKRYDFSYFLEKKKKILENVTHILVSIPVFEHHQYQSQLSEISLKIQQLRDTPHNLNQLSLRLLL